MFVISNHNFIRFLQGCRVLSWLLELGSPVFRINIMQALEHQKKKWQFAHRKEKINLLPMRACEHCWETFEPNTNWQIFCSKECSRNEQNRKGIIRRKQSLINGSGGAYLKLRFTIFRRDNFTCQYCGRNAQSGTVLHIDHIKPKTKGGKLKIDNLVTSCFECNEGKRDVLLTKREQKKLKSRTGVHCP